jgi:hypothetical protein
MSLPLEAIRGALWAQFGASLDAIERALDACPDELWGNEVHERAVWYLAFHTLFWCDLYLYGSAEGFAPPPPFGLEELDPAGTLPPRVYRRDEIRGYLRHVRARAHPRIRDLDERSAAATCTFRWGTITYLELLLYVLRHTQHHVGQLALLLRERADIGTPWVARALPAPH